MSLISLALIQMGGLIWLDNSRAIMHHNIHYISFEVGLKAIPGDGLISHNGGLQSMVSMVAGAGEPELANQDGPLSSPLSSLYFAFGNGDGDDNREPEVEVSAPHLTVVTIEATPLRRLHYRYTTRSYLDFGQLKVGPAIGITKDNSQPDLANNMATNYILVAIFYGKNAEINFKPRQANIIGLSGEMNHLGGFL